MEKMNLPPFYIGQKVVYITGINMPKGSIHTVSDIHVQPCGCVSLAIDGEKIKFRPVKQGYKAVVCDTCCKYNHPSEYKHGIHLYAWSADSFRPVQEAKPPLIKLTLSKIKETEKEQILIEN